MTECAGVKCKICQAINVNVLGRQSKCVIGVVFYLDLAAVSKASRWHWCRLSVDIFLVLCVIHAIICTNAVKFWIQLTYFS